MSQTNDPNDNYETDGSSALKNAASAAGKAAAKQAGKKVAKKAAQKVGTAATLKLGWPVILGGAAILVLVAGIILAMILIVASSGEESKPEGGGFWGGDISEIGLNEIPALFIPIYMEAQEKYGVPWNLLAAHHRVETRFSTIQPMISPVGATGHMQVRP